MNGQILKKNTGKHYVWYDKEIDDIEYDDVIISDYSCHPAIKGKVSV